ncbi:MAG: DNA polymerase III subunit delta [Deltaproteobacteria bacterium]|nr:MAG: DNA polymerase III subunit delta [Deltaproteobacteria bacterium]
MAVDLSPENVLNQLERGDLSPFYLFYGESEFLLERVLNRIRGTFIPEAGKDFNLQIFYGDDAGLDPGDILDSARSFPFLSQHRLVIVRRTEQIPSDILDTFIPYFEDPMATTCLIFVSRKPDFRKKFYRKIRESGTCVHFKRPYDNQIVGWMMRMAREIGLNIDRRACEYLYQIVGNRMMDLNSELEKICLRYGKTAVGLEDVRDFASYSRSYTIFELMDQISMRHSAGALSILRRYLQEEGTDTFHGIMGMLVRQMRLLWQTKGVLEEGGRENEISRKLGVARFVAGKLMKHARAWRGDELERAFEVLYQADGRLKSGSERNLILENIVLSLCR